MKGFSIIKFLTLLLAYPEHFSPICNRNEGTIYIGNIPETLLLIGE
jgi:hypothetical protein